MSKHIKLGFTEDSTAWAQAWTASLGAGASAEDAEIAAAMAQWAARDAMGN